MRITLPVEPDPFPCPPFRVRAAMRTDIGRERANNEDAAAIVELAAGFVGLVCDGMGGEAGGEVASRLAVETILEVLRVSGDLRPNALTRSIETAATRIKQEARRDPRLGRMGTTTTLAAVTGSSLVCAQVGDSRAYLFRRGALTQLTHDQTMAELLRSSGSIDPDRVHEIVGANVILQAVGSSVRLDIPMTFASVEEDDMILLCSDGLTGVVTDASIASILGATRDLENACEALVQTALAAGGPDNITCVVLRIERCSMAGI